MISNGKQPGKMKPRVVPKKTSQIAVHNAFFLIICCNLYEVVEDNDPSFYFSRNFNSLATNLISWTYFSVMSYCAKKKIHIFCHGRNP